MEDFKLKLRRYLIETNQKQQDFANKMGCSVSYVNRILSGSQNPSQGFISKLPKELAKLAIDEKIGRYVKYGNNKVR